KAPFADRVLANALFNSPFLSNLLLDEIENSLKTTTPDNIKSLELMKILLQQNFTTLQNLDPVKIKNLIEEIQGIDTLREAALKPPSLEELKTAYESYEALKTGASKEVNLKNLTKKMLEEKSPLQKVVTQQLLQELINPIIEKLSKEIDSKLTEAQKIQGILSFNPIENKTLEEIDKSIEEFRENLDIIGGFKNVIQELLKEPFQRRESSLEEHLFNQLKKVQEKADKLKGATAGTFTHGAFTAYETILKFMTTQASNEDLIQSLQASLLKIDLQHAEEKTARIIINTLPEAEALKALQKLAPKVDQDLLDHSKDLLALANLTDGQIVLPHYGNDPIITAQVALPISTKIGLHPPSNTDIEKLAKLSSNSPIFLYVMRYLLEKGYYSKAAELISNCNQGIANRILEMKKKSPDQQQINDLISKIPATE
ncbi:MAG: hypothetical protein JSS09_02455, partial [Verrucomicrobia bacterium]|nr:hypothetical protein [Verrucomicrobiota bacterium]